MNQAFDPFNIIILVVAVIVLLRLRSVLGTRTGHEKRIDPFSPPRANENGESDKTEDNVIQLPGRNADTEDEAEVTPVWQGYAAEGSPLASGLEKINTAERNFDPGEFIDGAKVAYEMIVTSFSQGDKKSLKNLLSKDVYAGFAGAIDQRKSNGETVDTRFVGIDEAEFVEASLSGHIANLTIKFVSQLISVTHDKDENVIDGDANQISEVTDIWTFERDVTSRDPNWSLSATQANG